MSEDAPDLRSGGSAPGDRGANSPGADAHAWADVTAAMEARVGSLADRNRVLLSAPADLARPCRPKVSLVKRLLGQRYVHQSPWVSITREEDHALARCVSDHEALGFPLSALERDSLLELGWRVGGPTDGPELQRWFPDDIPNGPYLPGSQAAAAASLAVATLREVFGVTDARTLVVS